MCSRRDLVMGMGENWTESLRDFVQTFVINIATSKSCNPMYRFHFHQTFQLETISGSNINFRFFTHFYFHCKKLFAAGQTYKCSLAAMFKNPAIKPNLSNHQIRHHRLKETAGHLIQNERNAESSFRAFCITSFCIK